MLSFALRRLVAAVPTVLLASVAIFIVLRLVPGDPAAGIAGPDATPEDRAAVQKQLGLTDSWPEQYIRWIGDLTRGNLGTSFQTGLDVRRLLASSFPSTLQLAVSAYLIALMIGIPMGVTAGVRPHSVWNWLLTGYTGIVLGIPNFIIGIVFLFLFSVRLGWLPLSGGTSLVHHPIEALKYLAMPAMALGMASAAVLARYTRTSISQVMQQDYIRTARAKGLKGSRVVYAHGLRSALIPIITVSSLQFGELLTGSVIVEQVFNRPGLGRLVVTALQDRDYLVIQSSLALLVGIFMTVNFLADIAYGLADPRARS